MASTRRGLEIPDADPTRTYSEEEKQRLTDQVRALLERVHAGEFSDRVLDIRLLQELHAAIFEGVRGHAGRPRSPHFGQETLRFGPHYAVHRRDVEKELRRVFAAVQRELARLEHVADEEGFVEGALRCAVCLHAEVVRIHPFEDGNGRTSRAIMNVVLVRMGLLPIALEVPRQEYYAVLNHYMIERDPEPLLDLAIRLAEE